MTDNTRDTNWADEYRTKRLKKLFTPSILEAEDDAEDLVSYINTQTRFKEGYDDRILLELLQNMDDAANKDPAHKAKSAKFILEGRRLRILNQGQTFSKKALSYICRSNISTKSADDPENTGSKGIGFRGILNWSENIKIYSGQFAVVFSKDKCLKALQEYKDNEIFKTASEIKPDWIDLYPVLAIPFNADDYPQEWKDGKYQDGETEYDTCIEIMLKDEYICDKYRQSVKTFVQTGKITSLFLLRLTDIQFIDNTEFITENNIEISKQDNHEQINGLDYFIKTIECDGVKKQYHLFKDGTETIAVPCEWEENTYTLYSTFPIQEKRCPFPVIMNSTEFDLKPERNSLQNTDKNDAIITKLQNMLVKQIAPYFAKPY